MQSTTIPSDNKRNGKSKMLLLMLGFTSSATAAVGPRLNHQPPIQVAAQISPSKTLPPPTSILKRPKLAQTEQYPMMMPQFPQMQ